MMASGIPANAKQLAALVKQGEGPALEFKRSTGELKEGMQTLCAFLNGSGGAVLFGVRPDGAIEGQDVSDRTLRDVAQAADRFEPPAHVSIHRIKVNTNRDVIGVFDDRIEIVNYGRLPTGITVEQLSGQHESKPVNPLIAGAFHRTGAVEVWGRGTNRVIAACKRHGIEPPKFEERQGFVVVTFKARMVAGGAAGTSADGTGQVGGQVLEFCRTPRKASEIQGLLGRRDRETFVNNYL